MAATFLPFPGGRAGRAEQFASAEVDVLVVDDDDSCARHGSEKINPRLPCNAGQAGKIEKRLTVRMVNRNGWAQAINGRSACQSG